jgi:DNA damage-binding protein 1
MCYARVDPTGSRYLLGDLIGHLFMLFLERGDGPEGTEVKDIKFEVLGELMVPKSQRSSFNNVMTSVNCD